MPRNNGWLAILAVSVVLSILRNSLAGERYPLNYGNPELQVNRSKSVRVHRDSSRPSLSTQYYTRDHGEWSRNPITPKDASKQIPKIPKTTKPYSHNEYRRSNDDPSIQPVQIKETKILDRPPRDHSIERSNYLPTIQSDVQGARRSTSLSKGIPRATRLSPRISDVAIKDTSAGSNHATHRPDEPATTGSRETARSETIRRGNGFVDLGYPYYGHVGVSSRDEESQAASTAAGGAAGRRGITWDVNSPEMERSDTKNGLETVSNIEKRDIGSWWRSRDVGKRGEMGEKGYSTMRVNDYVNRVPLVSDKSGLNIDEATGGEKLDRHGLMIRERDGGWRYRLVYDLMNGKRRPRRAVGKFREMLGLDSTDLNAPQFFDGSSASNDRFETEIVRQGYRSTGNEGLVYDSASRKSVTESMAENRDELDGVASKQRSTIGNDDQRDNGMEYSRTVDRNASGISFNETRTFDENSVGIIYNERAERLLERKINNDERNIGKGLTFNFIEETVVDNLSLHQKFNTSLSDGTGAMLRINSSILNNTYGLLESQINVGSIDTIKIDDSLNNKEIVRSELYENKTEMEPNSLRFEGPSNLISLNASEVTVDNRNLTKPIRDQEWQANLSSNHYSQLKMNIPTTNNSSQNWNTNETSFNRVKLSNSSNDQKFPSNISYDDNNSQLKPNLSVSITETSYISSNINKTSANINKTSISLNKTELVSTDPNKNAPQSQASALISKNATNTGILRAKNDSINVTNTKTVLGKTSKNDSQIPASIPILSNESKTKIFHLAKHLPEEIELEDSRSRIDGDQEEANRDPPEDRSVLSNVTKGEGNVLANSPRVSIAVPRNSTYPSHDMNTLAERSFSLQSKDLAQYDERNADDPFRNSSTTIQRRIAESSKIITNPRQPLMNKNDPSESKHLFPSSEKSQDISSLKAAKKIRKIDGGINQWIGSKDLKMEYYEAGLNGSLIVRKDENADDLGPRVPLSENGADEIKANEPAVRFSVKNAGDQTVRANSSDNGTANEVNPGQEDKESNDDPADRPSEDSTPSKVVAGPDGRSPKERTSRSSSKARRTASSLIQGRNMKIEGLLADKTSTSMWRKADIPSSGNLSTKNDSTSPGADKDTLGVHGKSPLNPRDRSTVSTMANGTAKILEELFSNENVTGVSLESVTSINDDEYQSFVFDASYVATSLEPNDEESHGTIMDSVDSHGTDNSTHELEPLDQWPVKHSAVVEGDLVLGGLMMVHEREDTITCGPVMPQGGVQALEAMLYTLDMLNEREIVPGVKIGAHILDDCDKDTYGLEMAVDFIKGTCLRLRH